MSTYTQETAPQWIKLNALKNSVLRFEAIDTNDNTYSRTIDANYFSLDDIDTQDRNEFLRLNQNVDITIPENITIKGYKLVYEAHNNIEGSHIVDFEENEEYEFGGIFRVEQFEIGDEIDE